MLDFAEKQFVIAGAIEAVQWLINPVGAFAGSMWYIAGLAALEAAKVGVASYAVGSWQVPHDQLAFIHKNEMILPAPVAQGVRSGNSSVGRSSYKPAQSSYMSGHITVSLGTVREANRNAEIATSQRF